MSGTVEEGKEAEGSRYGLQGGILSDTDLLARLDAFDVKADNPNFPFNRKTQIQPCSIDLRLSEVIWEPKRFRTIDLSNRTPLGPKITNAFRRKRISYPGGYLLRPGKFVLGRTYESFAIPSDLMGRLVGRSSLGRLGLSVVAPSNFINPGWRGHMPLMLINHSPFKIRIHPYLGVVQLCYFTLSSTCTRTYGAPALGSKYIDDDGGPSKYWLDETINTLRDNLNMKRASPEVEKLLEEFSKQLDEPTRMRLRRCLGKVGTVENTEEFVEAFIRIERRRSALLLVLTVAVGIPLAVLVSWLPTLISGGIFSWALAGLCGLVAVSLLVWMFRTQFATTFSPAELRKLADQMKRDM